MWRHRCMTSDAPLPLSFYVRARPDRTFHTAALSILHQKTFTCFSRSLLLSVLTVFGGGRNLRVTTYTKPIWHSYPKWGRFSNLPPPGGCEIHRNFVIVCNRRNKNGRLRLPPSPASSPFTSARTRRVFSRVLKKREGDDGVVCVCVWEGSSTLHTHAPI